MEAGECKAYKFGNILLVSGYIKVNAWPQMDLILIGIGGVKLIYNSMLFGAYGLGGDCIRSEAINYEDIVELLFRVPNNSNDYYFFNASFPIK